MSNNSFTPKSFYNTLTIIFVGIVVGILVFASIALFVTKEQYFNYEDTESFFYMLLPLVTFGGISASNYLYKQRINQAIEQKSLKEKLTNFRTAFILKLALLEFPALLGIVAFLMTFNTFYLLYTAIIVFIIAVQKPTLERIASHLRLSPNEQATLKKINTDLV